MSKDERQVAAAALFKEQKPRTPTSVNPATVGIFFALALAQLAAAESDSAGSLKDPTPTIIFLNPLVSPGIKVAVAGLMLGVLGMLYCLIRGSIPENRPGYS